jgi:pimeloyl-ACP methyl ester carboxylesterase
MNLQFLDRPEGQIAYEQSGQGPLVVCIPSMGDLRGEYRFLTPRLAAAGYRAVSMDLRGHGQSSSTGWSDYSLAGVGADLLALVSSLDAGPAIIIGTSMAAGAAIWAAAESPELISALIMIGPAVHGQNSALANLLYSLLFSRPWGPRLWQTYYRGLYPARKPADFAAYTAALKANLAEKGRIEALSAMIRAPKTASEERLAMVNQPALVLMGSKDPDFKDPQSEANWVAERVGATTQIIPDAGHYPHAEMPELTGQAILGFLDGLKVKPLEQHHAA